MTSYSDARYIRVVASKKRIKKSTQKCSTPVYPAKKIYPKKNYYLDKELSLDDGTRKLTRAEKKAQEARDAVMKIEVANDIKVINAQVNQILLSIGVTTKADETYGLRQQMLELMRFKYNIIESY